MREDLITGVIETKNRPVCFSMNTQSFEFCYISDQIYNYTGNNHPIKVPVADGFIMGKTHNNQPIAIYVGNSNIEFLGSYTMYPAAYIISKGAVYGCDDDFTKFDGIEFSGGTLNRVFFINGINIHYENNQTIVDYNDDSISFSFKAADDEIRIEVHSEVRGSFGKGGGGINNNTVTLRLLFNSPQDISTIFTHYNHIKELLSFMTFRENVGFETIALLKEHQELGFPIQFSEVLIRKDNELTTKRDFNNISFQDLATSLPNLMEIIYDMEEGKQEFFLGFIPSDDRDLMHINNSKVRLICSAVESELNLLNELDLTKQQELDELITTVRQTIKAFRKGKDKQDSLSNDTYNYIFSSISNWSFPLAERICMLYKKYQRELELLNKSCFSLTDEMIRAFVKYRNDITHGRHRTMDMEIAVTAHIMCGLVYCCILSRIGLTREKIEELCEEKMLT